MVTMANTKPVIDNMAVLRAVQKRVEEDGVVKVSIIGSVSKGLKGSSCLKWGIYLLLARWRSLMMTL